MHYHLEIVMPPTEDVEGSVRQILAPYAEQLDRDDEDAAPVRFWDWWVIGGRFAGAKFQATLNADKLKEFRAELTKRKVTVSGLTAGKEELKPAEQIPMVDALWNQYFPETGGGPCPLFNHSNNQYSSESLLPDDVMHFWTVPETLEIGRVIFAAPDHKAEKLETKFMCSEDFWNGSNHEKTMWDGTFKHAVEMFAKKRVGYKDEYADAMTPKDDWLVVTVDYHS